MRELTEKQKNMLDFIEDFQERSGLVPSVQEIGDHFGIKTATVFAHLRALQRKNHLSRSSKARSIVLNRKTLAHRIASGGWTIPLLGRVNAGNPADTPELRDGDFALPEGYAGQTSPDRLFALRVSGESMRDLGILDGDVVIVKHAHGTPRSGAVVVALVNGDETTVKSFFQLSDGRIELRPANSDFAVQTYDASQVKIQGRVIALERFY